MTVFIWSRSTHYQRLGTPPTTRKLKNVLADAKTSTEMLLFITQRQYLQQWEFPSNSMATWQMPSDSLQLDS